MNVGTLRDVQYDSTNLEAWESNNFDYFLELAAPPSHEDENGKLAPTDVDKILFWIHRNLNVRPKIWLSKQLTRLNNLVQTIHVNIETLPGEKSLWNKVISKITRVIMEITEKLNNYLKDDKKQYLEYRDSTGYKKFKNLGNINSVKSADQDIKQINKVIDEFSDDMKSSGHSYLNKINQLHNKHKSGFASDEVNKEYNDMNKRMIKLRGIELDQDDMGQNNPIRDRILKFHLAKKR